MSSRTAGRGVPWGRPHRRYAANVLVGIALGGAVLALKDSLGFVSGLGSSVAIPSPQSGLPLAGHIEVPRADEPPRTQMHGRWPDRTRLQGGGRLPMSMNRHPVLAYSTTDDTSSSGLSRYPESANSVIRRMYDMYETDYNKMIQQRQKYFRSPPKKRKFMADFSMRAGAKRKANRIKRAYQDEWLYWMRTEGRKRGLTEPIIFNGPPLAYQMTPEHDAETEPAYFRKKFGSTKEEMKEMDKKYAPKGREKFPYDYEDGAFKEKDDPENPFNVWKRPLHKHAYDIGKRGRKKVTRGLVF